MSRTDAARLADIVVACGVIADYVERADDDQIVFDAIRVRLIEIGEAVKGLSSPVRKLEPSIPWTEIARMRDLLAHRYFDTSHAIVMATARAEVPLLGEAAARLADRIPDHEG